MVAPISENHDAESPTCVRQIHPTLVPVFNRVPLFQVSTASGLIHHTYHDHDGVIHKQIMHSFPHHKVSHIFTTSISYHMQHIWTFYVVQTRVYMLRMICRRNWYAQPCLIRFFSYPWLTPK